MDNTHLSQIAQTSANHDSGTYDYADVQNTGISALSKPNSLHTISRVDGYEPSPAQKPTNQTSYPDSDMYAYADVNNFGTTASTTSNSTDNYDYADTAPSEPGKASGFPIYSQVNKSFKRDELKNEENDGQDSGMVENIVYVSAGPKLCH